MSKAKPPCCGADRTWLGPLVQMMRGKPPRVKASKRVFHVRGDEVFWHWRDQRLRLHKDYR